MVAKSQEDAAAGLRRNRTKGTDYPRRELLSRRTLGEGLQLNFQTIAALVESVTRPIQGRDRAHATLAEARCHSRRQEQAMRLLLRVVAPQQHKTAPAEHRHRLDRGRAPANSHSKGTRRL